jgi:hypothetical protein
VTFRKLGLFGLVEMAVFIGLVFVAYAYIWRKGGFDWAHSAVTPIDDVLREPAPEPLVVEVADAG